MNNTTQNTIANKTLAEAIYGHEAAHVVMRWIQGMPATKVEDAAGGLLVHGTGKECSPQDLLLVRLAGIAYDSDYGLSSIDWKKSKGHDFNDARGLVEKHFWLRLYADFEGVSPDADEAPEAVLQDVEETLGRWFEQACRKLSCCTDLVEIFTKEIQENKVLSAKCVTEIIDDYIALNEHFDQASSDTPKNDFENGNWIKVQPTPEELAAQSEAA